MWCAAVHCSFSVSSDDTGSYLLWWFWRETMAMCELFLFCHAFGSSDCLGNIFPLHKRETTLYAVFRSFSFDVRVQLSSIYHIKFFIFLTDANETLECTTLSFWRPNWIFPANNAALFLTLFCVVFQSGLWWSFYRSVCLLHLIWHRNHPLTVYFS